MTDADCVFCKIVAGAIPAHKVFEDDDAFAFLDINPLQHGHVLVIPKEHAGRLGDLSDAAAAGLGRAVRTVTARATQATGADGATVAVNDGAAAGQEVPHVHFHIVPRRDDDGIGPIHALFVGHAPAEAGDLADLAKRMAP